VGCLPRI